MLHLLYCMQLYHGTPAWRKERSRRRQGHLTLTNTTDSMTPEQRLGLAAESSSASKTPQGGEQQGATVVEEEGMEALPGKKPVKRQSSWGPNSAPPAVDAGPSQLVVASAENLSPSTSDGSAPAAGGEDVILSIRSAPGPCTTSGCHQQGSTLTPPATTTEAAATPAVAAASPARSVPPSSADDMHWDPTCPPALKQLIVSCLRDDAQVCVTLWLSTMGVWLLSQSAWLVLLPGTAAVLNTVLHALSRNGWISSACARAHVPAFMRPAIHSEQAASSARYLWLNPWGPST